MAKRGIEDQKANLSIREAFRSFESRIKKESRAGTAHNSFNDEVREALSKDDNDDDNEGEWTVCATCNRPLDN